MATLNTTAAWTITPAAAETKTTLWSKIVDFATNQKQNHTLWFFLTLVIHGVLVLPVPAMLIYYFNGPEVILAITMVCFFVNIIANMGGAGIKTTLAVFAGSVLIHLAMILLFVL